MLAASVFIIMLSIAALAGIAQVFIVILAVVGASFAIATINASPRPPDSRLVPAAKVRLWLGEVVVAWLIMLWFMPFERWLMRRSTVGRREGLVPVLLIHGYVNNAGALFILWRAIKRAGHGVHTINLEPVYGSIDAYAEQIEARLAQIQLASGGQRVALVCHSMGGLAARAYLRRHGGSRVARVVTLGTPHAGTILARAAMGENGRQMCLGSAWLGELARYEQGSWPCPLASLYSRDDNVVVPQLSAHLDGARNIALAGLGHVSLPMSPGVAVIVVAELSAPPFRPGETSVSG